jgi:16S rRNA (adenine1518-N6/adenine1519-N6)-dimethyltransferase
MAEVADSCSIYPQTAQTKLMTSKPAIHRPRKRFGQNFLRDEGVIGRIIGAIQPCEYDHLVEIGPGQVALT